MEKLIITILVLALISIASATATFYPEPFVNNVDANRYNLTGANTISADTFIGLDLYVDNIYGNPTWCYQEFANTSTSCGGLATGIYNTTGNWSGNLTNIYDGIWDTYGAHNATNTTTYFYVNYSVPNEALAASLWTIKRASAVNNYSIPSQCWGIDPLIFRAVMINRTDQTNVNYWQCSNSTTNYFNVTAQQSGSFLYEEAMWWKFASNASLTGTLNWTLLEEYPAACPGSSAITQLDDAVTCSDLWLDSDGLDNVTGLAGTFTGGNATVCIWDNGSLFTGDNGVC